MGLLYLLYAFTACKGKRKSNFLLTFLETFPSGFPTKFCVHFSFLPRALRAQFLDYIALMFGEYGHLLSLGELSPLC